MINVGLKKELKMKYVRSGQFGQKLNKIEKY